jgi:hypothetical protein
MDETGMQSKKLAENLRDHPVYICGHPKSGTSLVRSILDSHPQLIVYPEETVFFRRYLPKAQGQPLARQLELADELLIHIFTWNLTNPPASQEGFADRDYSSISFTAIRDSMRENIGQNYRDERDILSAVVLAFGQVTGQINENTRRWVEKSPYNEFFTQQIFSWWPDSRCIHVVRDPRDNFLSYHSKQPTWSPEFFSLNWRRSTRSAQKNQVYFGSDRYMILRYEDLVQSPNQEIKRLLNFLQIDWDLSLVKPTRAGSTWQGNSMFADTFQEISSAPVGRWKGKLSELDALLIQKITQEDMKHLNYTLIHPRMHWSDKLIINGRVLTLPFRQKIKQFKKN